MTHKTPLPQAPAPTPAPTHHCFIVPYRTKEGRKYAYNYHVYEYDPATGHIGPKIISSKDPEFDTARALNDKNLSGEIYFWKTTASWCTRIKDIATSAQKRTEETERVGPRISKREEWNND